MYESKESDDASLGRDDIVDHTYLFSIWGQVCCSHPPYTHTHRISPPIATDHRNQSIKQQDFFFCLFSLCRLREELETRGQHDNKIRSLISRPFHNIELEYYVGTKHGL